MEWCCLRIVDESGGPPDMSIVDQIARLALVAQRAGARLVLDQVSADLAGLLELSGLGVEMGRQAERREQALEIEGREEDGELGDLPS